MDCKCGIILKHVLCTLPTRLDGLEFSLTDAQLTDRKALQTFFLFGRPQNVFVNKEAALSPAGFDYNSPRIDLV